MAFDQQPGLVDLFEFATGDRAHLRTLARKQRDEPFGGEPVKRLSHRGA